MNIELVRCLVKSIHVLLCPNATVTYLGASWHPWNLLKPLKTIQKHDFHEKNVFWGGPGQNGRFWGSFLIHWHSKKYEYWGFLMFGKVNPSPAVSKSIPMVFRSSPEPLKPFKTIKNDSKTRFSWKESEFW